jgi:hypothetical protein
LRKEADPIILNIRERSIILKGLILMISVPRFPRVKEQKYREKMRDKVQRRCFFYFISIDKEGKVLWM